MILNMDYNNYFVLVTVCIITHMVRSVYEILKHKKIIKSNRVTFVIVFINMAVLWTSWFTLCSVDVYKIILPDIIRYFGLVLSFIGVIFFLVALFTIKTLETYEGDLIIKGIYSKIRHPMYLGFILWLLGFPIYSEGLFSFVLSFIFIANILFWRHVEEKELEKRFISYTDYRKTTIF
jgi:protein-S-isoprenylcysteine O-methyltransferase Ste14